MDVFSCMMKEVVCRYDGRLPFFVSRPVSSFTDACAIHVESHILMWEWMMDGNDCDEIWRNFGGDP